jgi:cysteinyl-tRNA synthetase
LPPPEVLALWQERKDARGRGDWSRADVLRKRIGTLGWQVLDTPEGPRLEFLPHGVGTQDAAPAGRADVG